MQRIKMTEDLAREAAKEFYEKIVKNDKILGTSIDFKYNLKKKAEEKIQITFTAEAYEKMRALIDNFTGEIGWHGLVNRVSDKEFEIYDIIVYPQTVTGTTVNTDQQAYQEWLMSQPDEIFNSIRMQGHSHVNMAVFASPEDSRDQTRLIDNLMHEDWYIFMIWNKRMEHYVRVVDMKENISYDTDDVDIYFEGNNMTSFLREANAIVKTFSAAYGASYGIGGYSSRNGAKTVAYGGTAAAGVSKNNTATGVVSSAPTQQKAGGVYFGTSTPKSSEKEVQKKKEEVIGDDDDSDEYDGLASYYATHQSDLRQYGNSSCFPYAID